ncbi:hypothetical protein [Anabaena lutea]|uniref:Uncharacterized protein n=1 Tax=Anabaena lutea FACHB-196 TaxID=2692881 RepID=A0ABR8FFB3_9NOST|nr:hypothetical protein [Anabaena lutea]MBD2568469.1 hypothetical protein [Anabaena lutea FACHB-196]
MLTETVTLQIPEIIYQRLVNTAHATQRPLEEVMLHALQVGSPPAWDDVPEEFQAELAALDKLDDNILWQIFHSQKTGVDMEEYNILLEKNSSGTLTETERLNLISLRHEADLFMLRKAQAAVLLRWRGSSLPNP